MVVERQVSGHLSDRTCSLKADAHSGLERPKRSCKTNGTMNDQRFLQHRNSLGYIVTNREATGEAARAMIVWGIGAGGRRVFIDDATRGGADGLKCACGSRLIARKGEINAHHFAHEARSGAICRTAQLTALAEFGAEEIRKAGQLRLPSVERKNGRAKVEAVSSQILGDHAVVTITSTDARKLLVLLRATTRRTALNDATLRDGISSIVVEIALYRNLADDAIARAIVSQAPREWIFNAQLPAAKAGPIGVLRAGLTVTSNPNKHPGTSSREKHHGTSKPDTHRDTSCRDQCHELSIAEIRRILFPDL